MSCSYGNMVYKRLLGKNRHRLINKRKVIKHLYQNWYRVSLLFTKGESNKIVENNRHVSYNKVVVLLGLKIVTINFHGTTIKISFEAKNWNANIILPFSYNVFMINKSNISSMNEHVTFCLMYFVWHWAKSSLQRLLFNAMSLWDFPHDFPHE